MQPGVNVDLCVHANVFTGSCVLSGSNATVVRRLASAGLLVSYS